MKHVNPIFIVLLWTIAFSCKEDPIKLEQQLAIDYLLANGFTIDENKTMLTKLTPQRVFTLDSAKKIVQQLSQLQTDFNGEDSFSTKSDSRVALIPCDDAGTYYISRAIYGPFAGVDISYTINAFGNIGDIHSFATGFVLAWSWEEIGSKIYKPESSFCVQGIITYGVDISGLALGYRQSVALRVTLRGCNFQVKQSYGSC